LSESLKSNEFRVYKTPGRQTYRIYLEMNLFMKAPAMEMLGSMENDIARDSRQFLANAKTKPVKNAARKLTTRATFSDMP